MLELQNNKYIRKILDNSRQLWNYDIAPLSLSQIEWRLENRREVIGISTYDGLFLRRSIQLILIKSDDGSFKLFSPSTKKDKTIPCFLYDIMDIEEFVKRYPIQVVYDDNIDLPLDELYDELLEIRNRPTRGFIETRKDLETEIYEIKL